MNLKRILTVFAAFLLIAAPALLPMPVYADTQQEPTVRMESKVYPIMMPKGGNIPLSAEYFEMRLGLPAGEIAAITITSLPQKGSGKLMLDGVEVQVRDTIFRSELDRLCYVQDENALAASSGWFSFIPLCSSDILKKDGGGKICATFQVSENSDGLARPIVQDVFCLTNPDTQVYAALDTLQGDVVYTMSRKPQKGVVSFSDGRCIYTPNEGESGTDSFILTALDEHGGVSAPIRVQVAITK